MNMFRATKRYFSKKIRHLVRYMHTPYRPEYPGRSNNAVQMRTYAYGLHWRKA